MADTRPDIHHYMMELAFVAAKRSTCPRRKVGAVLSAYGHVVATGYNGSPPNMPHCTDVGCLTDGPTPNCHRTVHAELNALLHAETPGNVLYCTDQPCLTCLKAALTAGVEYIFYARPYPDTVRDAFVAAHDIEDMLIPMEDFNVE